MKDDTRLMRDELREAVAAVREGRVSDDIHHFYGAWFGASEKMGGHPATMERTHEHLATGDDVTHNEMAAMYQGWDAKLDKPMANALESYVGDDYVDVNHMLTGKAHFGPYSTEGERLPEEVVQLDRALDAVPLDRSITVWRGGSGADLIGAKVGDVIERKGYTSTSLNRKIATEFADFRANHDGSQPTIYKMLLPAGLHGAYLDASFDHPFEEEYLIGRDTRWLIQSISDEGDRRVVTVAPE